MKLFGRKKGRTLSAAKKKILEKVFPKLRIYSDKKIGKNVFNEFSCEVNSFWLEVGFGNGEHINWQLEKNPNIAFFCSEPYLNGTANFLASLKEENYERIRILMEDGESLLNLLPSASISKTFILFPDPWPKKKHQKRRFINNHIIQKLSRVMKSNGELRIATDSSSYCAWILHFVLKSEEFVWQAKCKKDFLSKPEDWPMTRYEKKAILSGKSPIYLIFRKKIN